jgi:hypothetical protein
MNDVKNPETIDEKLALIATLDDQSASLLRTIADNKKSKARLLREIRDELKEVHDRIKRQRKPSAAK